MSNLSYKPPNWLLANHDVVLLGYRGVDGSVALDSPEITRAFRKTGGDLLSDQSLRNFHNAFAQTYQRLRHEGVDVEGYTIPEVVADLEMARDALGYSRINLLSVSYGTRVAQIYAYLHPERLFRSAMIGVNPPGHFIWEPATIDSQLAYYASLWARDTGASTRSADLAATLRSVTQQMPHRWLCFPIDPGKVKAMTFVMLFSRKTAALVFDSYLAAAQGDASGLALLSLLCDALLPKMFTWGDFLAKGLSADFDPARDYKTELNPPDFILGSPLSYVFYAAAGDAWPMQPIAAELRQVHPSSVETLLVSGSIDFSTPAAFTRDELLPTLANGKHIVLAEMGHVDDLLGLQPQATERLLSSFYDTGIADDSLYVYAPMHFRVPFGLPRISKTLLAAVLALFMAAGGVAAWQWLGSLKEQTLAPCCQDDYCERWAGQDRVTKSRLAHR